MKLRVDFSDLREHRFNHNFNCPSPVCKCNGGEESTEHYLLRCALYNVQRQELLSGISNIVNNDVSVLPDGHLAKVALYGTNSYNNIANKLIIEETIRYIKNTKRFNSLEAFKM